MGGIYVLLLMCTAILATSGLCLVGDTNMCSAGQPLILGGRIQPLTREGEFLDPFWNNEGKKFVFLRQPGRERISRGLHGKRGVIKIGEIERTCSGSGESDATCPIPATDVPCGMSPSDISASAPLVFSNITSTGLVVSWETLHEAASRRDPAITLYILKYREVSKTSFDFEEVIVSVRPSHQLFNLKPDTLYEFHLVPISEDVTEQIKPTRVQTVRTRCGVPPTPSFYMNARTSRSITFGIYPRTPGEWKCRDQTTTLQVLVEGTWEHVRVLDNSDTSTTVEDLTPCSRYSYRLKLSNIHETAYTDAQDITTDEEGYSGVIEPVGESIEPGTLNISWTPPDMNDTACDVSRYRIEYYLVRHKACSEDEQPVEVYSHGVDKVEVYGTETSALLTNLVDYADYNISITPVVDGIGVSIDGETVWFVESTTTAVPSGILDPSVRINASNIQEINFSWLSLPCEHHNGDNITYLCQLYLTNFGSRPVLEGTQVVSSEMCTFKDIRACGNYSFTVTPENRNGLGHTSHEVTARIPATGHGGVKEPVGESIKPGTLNVSWTPPDMTDTACDVSRYRIEYFLVRHKACSEDEQPAEVYGHRIYEVEVSGKETSVLLTNLADYADYNVSITPVVDEIDVSIDGEAVWFVESTTTAELKGIPDGVLLESVSQSHMTFSWSPPRCTSRNGIITGYSYILKHNSEVVSTGTVDTNSVRIADLEWDTEYTFSVAAMASAGSGPYSQPLTEATRSRGGCPGKHPLRLGGVLTSLTRDPSPWGSGQPIFVVSRHLLPRQGRRVGHPFGHGGIIRIGRIERSPCDGSQEAGICRPSPETLQELPGNCPAMEGSGMTCEAANPKFSYERKDVISFERLSLTDVKVTWRDWEVTKDKGVGPVTGYVLRYRRRGVGEPLKEIRKGISLHHSLFNLEVNADYEFEVVPLKDGFREEIIETREMDTLLQEPLPVLYRTGCGELDPVQNITVATNDQHGTLVVSWDAPVGFCPVEYYNYTINLLPTLKACPDSFEGDYTKLYPEITLETNVTFPGLDDFAEYTISVTPVTAMLEGGGYLYGEVTSIVGTTLQNDPDYTPKPSVITTNPTSVVLSWNHLECWRLRGTFTNYSYTLRQEDGLEISGNTLDDRVEIVGLSAFTRFTFELQLHTTWGSAEVSIVSDATEPSTPLFYNNLTSVLYIENVTASSVTLSWPKWNDKTDNGTGTVESYILLYNKPGESPDFREVGLNLSATIDNLDVDTEYDFQIMIIGRGGSRGIPSDLQRIQTKCGVPVLPELEIRSIPSPYNVIFNIQVPREEGWRCREMVAHLQREEDGEWEDTKELDNKQITKPDEYYEQLDDFVPCSRVVYRIKMVNTHHTVYSKPLNFTTNGVLNPVRNLTVTPTDNPGELYVDWEKPEINNCPITNYTVEYHKLGDPACERNIKEFIDLELVEETHVTISDLEPYTFYNIEVAPVLSGYAGKPPKGESRAVLTRGDVPSGVLDPWVGINASSVQELKFSWEELSCEYHNGDNLTYLCQLYLTNSGSRPVLEGTRVVSSETCTFKNLKACGNYSFTVTPGNMYGLGSASHAVTARIPATALGPVENISTVARPNGEVFVRWERDEITSLCPVIGYKLNYELQRQQACRVCVDLKQPPLHTENSSYILQNLKAFSTYKINISVQMDDEGSQGLVLKEKIFTTMSAAPTEAPVVWVENSLRKNTSLTFKWNTINCTALNGIFKQYTFRSNATKGEIGISNRRRRFRTLKHLKPCTTYDFHIRVMNSMGGGPFGTAVGTTTLGKPGGDFGLRSETVTGGVVLISWQEPAEYSCPIDSYIIGVRLTEDPCVDTGVPENVQREERTVDRDVTSIHMDEIPAKSEILKANSVYQVTLRARNSEGEGEEDILEVTTPASLPTGYPTDISQYDVTDESATVSWGDVPCSQRNGDIVGYSYELSGDIRRKGETTEKEITLTGLYPFSVYTFRVRAKTSAGYGPFSKPIQFHTSG